MNNQEVAVSLVRIGKMMKIAGANSFKVRAFERAAEAIEALGEPVSEIAARDELTGIDGVGKSIAADITQLLDTGTCDAWDELTATYPETLLDLLQLQGVGPKKVAALHSELGVSDLESLREAVESGDIPSIKGFSKKSVDKIAGELDRLARYAGRMVIGLARPLAERVREHLAAVPGVESVTVAGSLRRWAETVGDLDFVALAPGDPMAVMDALVAFEDTDDVLGHGAAKTSVRLKNGMQCDLRVFKPEQWGSAVHHFTGSKFHHIELRMRAQKRGLKISEYGVHKVDGDELVAGASEAEVYAALDLPFIPPELREGRGEVDAAAKGELPDLIALEHIRGDLHMHTTWSDGAFSIAEMGEAAKAKGYEYICITDHSQALVVANGLDAERLRKQIAAVREANAQVDGIEIMAGIEVDILRDGSLDLPDDVLDELDWVIGSVHSAFSITRAQMTERVVKAISTGKIDAVGHPTGRRLGQRDGYELDLEAVIAAAKAHAVALEINASPKRLDLSDMMARRARDAGVKITINTDAHSIRGFDVMPFGIHTARRGWVERGDVINAMPYAELRAWLSARRA